MFPQSVSVTPTICRVLAGCAMWLDNLTALAYVDSSMGQRPKNFHLARSVFAPAAADAFDIVFAGVSTQRNDES
jgi:hypothetical protein